MPCREDLGTAHLDPHLDRVTLAPMQPDPAWTQKKILSLHFFRFGFHLPLYFLCHVCGHTNARDNGLVLEWSTLLEGSSCIFELST